MAFDRPAVAEDPDATVLWVTDDPALNEQTKRKMLQAASILVIGNLRHKAITEHRHRAPNSTS